VKAVVPGKKACRTFASLPLTTIDKKDKKGRIKKPGVGEAVPPYQYLI